MQLEDQRWIIDSNLKITISWHSYLTHNYTELTKANSYCTGCPCYGTPLKYLIYNKYYYDILAAMNMLVMPESFLTYILLMAMVTLYIVANRPGMPWTVQGFDQF